MRVIDQLIKEIREKGKYYDEAQVAPACILWTDRERQWETAIPLLQAEMPELLVLGEYIPEKRMGPAIWLRCAIARKTDDVQVPDDKIPVIYLPQVSRQELRDAKNCPDPLKPLVELQYRGVLWSQSSAKDWTILAFLKSKDGGINLDIALDNETKNAMQLALQKLLDVEIDALQGKQLDKVFFNTLLTSGDTVRDLLQWLDQGDAFKSKKSDVEWKGFVNICVTQFVFDPNKEGRISAATKFALHEGPWSPVWHRYCEAPRRYPTIPKLLRTCNPPKSTLDWHTGGQAIEGWPQWNDEQENNLRNDLKTLESIPPQDARKKIITLEKSHCQRRSFIWAELGEANLAQSLQHLVVLAKGTSNALVSGSLDNIVAAYRTSGWNCDDAVIRALAAVQKPEDIDAVTIAIRSIYTPWAEESARYVQKIVNEGEYPGRWQSTRVPAQKDGECIVFVDGLRFDTAKRLAEKLDARGYQVDESLYWTALPSVTSTGKPAVSPVKNKIVGPESSTDFEPIVKETGQSLKGGAALKKLLQQEGWEILEQSSLGKSSGRGWTESGNIDHDGHDRGAKLAHYLDNILTEVSERIHYLLKGGWRSVRVVTDHGWLLLPGGLPKSELAKALVSTKWGRCAAIKEGAHTDERQYPWYWNEHQHFALADGICAYRNGLEYDHGGLSLQECLLLELQIWAKDTSSRNPVKIDTVVWNEQLCKVTLDHEAPGYYLDIRMHPADPSTSVVFKKKQFGQENTLSVIVEDEDLKDKQAIIVIIDNAGNIINQQSTTIGELHND